MKKTLLTALLTGFVVMSFSAMANAATFTYTKPSFEINTTKEEAAVNKKISELEKAQQEAKAKQAKQEADAKAKQEKLKKDIESYKKQAEADQAKIKKDIETAKKENEAKKQQRAAAMDKFKMDTQNSINNLKKSYTNN